MLVRLIQCLRDKGSMSVNGLFHVTVLSKKEVGSFGRLNGLFLTFVLKFKIEFVTCAFSVSIVYHRGS